MNFFDFSLEVTEKRKWVYKNLVRKNMKERFEAILKYTGYTVDDLACLLNKTPKTIERYMRDCTKIPIDDLLLIALFCNVRIDCFPDTVFYFDLEDGKV
ncbi:MAG: helix-turn-helix transcriptional regulator [Alphaproteobacteria bacterium]|nr:helix-turn-helix transcriptional regulator [Alphaproteobacteria bacterium]MBO5441579.1 helix-turn-helix transcriptional regulator [Alphaproteobacteria bacterium]